MIDKGYIYKGAYQQGYSDAIRDFSKKSTDADILDEIRAKIDSETRAQVKDYINADIIIDAVLNTIAKMEVEAWQKEKQCR